LKPSLHGWKLVGSIGVEQHLAADFLLPELLEVRPKLVRVCGSHMGSGATWVAA
jgi:hypothetical protein